jgi:hypothetical protein
MDTEWTMPEWLTPRRFQTVFTSEAARSAWIGFLNDTAYHLKDIPNIHSWQMMNEPYRREWAADVSVEAWLELWGEMKTVFKMHSDKPVSIRFAEDSLSKSFHFDHDPRIYELLDYVSINWYEVNTVENLTKTVADIRKYGKTVMISEFGYETPDDLTQQVKVDGYIALFQRLGISEVTAFFWRADYAKGEPSPPGQGYNLAKDVYGTPRPAFFTLRASS